MNDWWFFPSVCTACTDFNHKVHKEEQRGKLRMFNHKERKEDKDALIKSNAYIISLKQVLFNNI